MTTERGKFRIVYVDFLRKYHVEKSFDPWGAYWDTVYSSASRADCSEWLGRVIADSTPEALADRERAIAEDRKALKLRQEDRAKKLDLGYIYDAATDQWFDPPHMDAA